MMITTMVLGIIVAATVPVAMSNERTIVLGAARQLTADLEYAQVRSITQPTTPTVVAVLNDRSGYYLANADLPETPIDLPDGVVGAGDPYAVTFGGYRATTLDGVTIRLMTGGVEQVGLGVKTIEFDQYGRLDSAQDAVFEVAFAGSSVRIRVAALTGSVRSE
ncbi:MAG: Tfp pilus assembly protein FimT/FimU [Phycisphaerales bacterium JB038]